MPNYNIQSCKVGDFENKFLTRRFVTIISAKTTVKLSYLEKLDVRTGCEETSRGEMRSPAMLSAKQ